MAVPTADHSVRVAWADDAADIARLQADAWRAAYAGLLPADAVDLDVDRAAAAWRAALVASSDARNRVLVALEVNRVVGFAVTIPASDPDCDPVRVGELGEFAVALEARGRGHGSRLLQAVVDTMVADRFDTAVTWLLAGDDRLRAFLTAAGWAPDTAHRELDLDGSGSSRVKQVRLHTALS